MRKKFLVCILLPCCILIAACGHTADTKNDLLSENITSDTETDTQTSDYEKYNNYGSTEEQMDEAITETSETASSSEENDLPEQSLQKYSDDWDESQILEELQKRNTYHDYCSFYPEYVRYMENVMEVRDISMNIYPIYATDTRYYQASDFSNVPPLIIHLAKNEIYARHGYIFKNQDLNAYFLSSSGIYRNSTRKLLIPLFSMNMKTRIFNYWYSLILTNKKFPFCFLFLKLYAS